MTKFAALLAVSCLISIASCQVKIACVGDSITAGVCSDVTHGYPAVLQTLLGSAYTVGNYGSSGRTMLKKGLCDPTGDDCSYWDTATYTAAMASEPAIVTIMLGTNDAKNFNWFGVQQQGDSYVADFLDMIGKFQALPTKPQVYIMTPPPLYPPDPYDMNQTVINVLFPVLIPSIAKSAGNVSVIDVFDALGGANLTQPGITCDGCHPVDKGYVEIATTMYTAIKGQPPTVPQLLELKRSLYARSRLGSKRSAVVPSKNVVKMPDEAINRKRGRLDA